MVFSLSFQRRLNFDEREIRLLRVEADRLDAPDAAFSLLNDALTDIQASRRLLQQNPDRAFELGRQAEQRFVGAQRVMSRGVERSFQRWTTAARVDFWASEILTHGGLAYFNPLLAAAFAAGPNLIYAAYVEDQFQVLRDGPSPVQPVILQNPLHDEANEAILAATASGQNARFGDYFIRRELDDLRGRPQTRASMSPEERRDFAAHWENIQNEVRNYRPDRHLNEEEQLIAVSQLIYYSAGLGPYHKGQTQFLAWHQGDGGNCVLRSKVFASLLAESPALRPPWRITVRYYDGDESNDGHQEVILYNPDTGHMIDPMTGEIFTESDSPLFDSSCLYAEDLMAHGQDPIHEFDSFRRYTPRSWAASRLSVPQSGPIQAGRMSRMRVGVVGHGGHAPDHAYSPPPMLHSAAVRTQNAQVVDDLPESMSTEKVNALLENPLLFHPTEHNFFTQMRFQNGVPFVVNAESHQVEFASYPFYQRFHRLRSGQRRLDYLRRLVDRFLAQDAAAQRRARFILQDADNIVLYTPAQISATAEYLLNLRGLRGGLGDWENDLTASDFEACHHFAQRNNPDQLLAKIDRLPLYARGPAFYFFANAIEIQDAHIFGDELKAQFLRAALLRIQRQETGRGTLEAPVSRHSLLLARFNPNGRGLTGVFTRPESVDTEGLGNEARLSEDTLFAILANLHDGVLSNSTNYLEPNEKRALARWVRRRVGLGPNQRSPSIVGSESETLIRRLERLRAFSEEEANQREREVREVFATRDGGRIFSAYIDRHFSAYTLLRSDD